MMRRAGSLHGFKAVYKGYLVRVTTDESHCEFQVVFYTAATSTKHEITLSAQEFFEVTGYEKGLQPLALSSTQIHMLFAHMEKNIPSLTSTPTKQNTRVGQREEMVRQASMLREAQELEANQDFLGSIEVAKRCISSARHIKASLCATDTDSGPLQDDIAKILSQAYTVMGEAHRHLGKKSKSAACFSLAAKLSPDSRISLNNFKDALEICDDTRASELLASFDLTSIREPAGFSCNSCGECCRTREIVALSPLDLFMMTRSSAMQGHNITTTLQLYRHNHFNARVLLFAVDEHGQPTCSLSPSKREEGHCRFAYPLFKQANRGVLDYEDTSEYLAFCASPFERESAQWEDKAKAEEWLHHENAMEEKYGDVIPSTTASGRQALGCMLGSSKPTECSAFPFSPELVYADHNYAALDWEDGAIVVSKGGCEGFDPSLAPSEEFPSVVPASLPGYPMTEAQERASWSPSKQHLLDDKGTPTVMDYLTRAEPELIKRMEEWRWFASLRQELREELSFDLDTLRFEGVMAHFTHIMMQAWYNFDILAKPRRPIKSYQRMKREVTIASWNVVKATKTWLATVPADKAEGAVSEEQLVEDYKNLMRRLNTLNEHN